MSSGEEQIFRKAEQASHSRTAEQRALERQNSLADSVKGTYPIHLKRARYEVTRQPESSPLAAAEARIHRLELRRQPGEGIEKYRQVSRLEQRFNSPQALDQYRQEAWSRLENSREGQMLLKQAGGKEKLIHQMDARGDFITRTASLCENAGLDDTAIGRNVHRMAELFTIEKQPGEILKGVRSVEQRVEYTDPSGRKLHVEIDDITRRGEKIFIRDYKPINLRHFEETSAGQKWAKWLEKNVGSDFRERIQSGESPFFQIETQGKMPKHLTRELQKYIRDVTDHHKQQLEKYRELYSQAASIDRASIQASVRPYFKFT